MAGESGEFPFWHEHLDAITQLHLIHNTPSALGRICHDAHLLPSPQLLHMPYEIKAQECVPGQYISSTYFPVASHTTDIAAQFAGRATRSTRPAVRTLALHTKADNIVTRWRRGKKRAVGRSSGLTVP
jgi:hypothetical protein